MLRAAWRLTSVPLLMLLFMLSGLILQRLVINSKKREPWTIRMVHFYCRMVVKFLRIELVSRDLRLPASENFLIVANHQSYLDIVLIGALFPSVFITSVEIQQTFFLGFLCRMAGCKFVERRKIWNIKNEIHEISASLNAGQNVCIFPEGSTTNGETLNRFKSSLIETAKISKTKVLPICINYRQIEGKNVARHNRDLVNWYGDMTFADHFLRLILRRNMVVHLDILSEIKGSEALTRKHITQKAREEIVRNFSPITG